MKRRAVQLQISKFFCSKQRNTGSSETATAVTARGTEGEENPSKVQDEEVTSNASNPGLAASVSDDGGGVGVASEAVQAESRPTGGGGGSDGGGGDAIGELRNIGDGESGEVDEQEELVDDPEEVVDVSQQKSSDTKLSSLSSADVPPIAFKNQPSKSFRFPATDGRRCVSVWFSNYPWLHYDVEKDAVFCYVCVKACGMVDKGNTSWFNSASPAFIINGCRKWKKCPELFKDHEKSHFHHKNVELIFLRESVVPVPAQLNKNLAKEQGIARKCLRAIISSIRFLARTGNALRGHGHNDGNLQHLLEERSADIPELPQWLERRNSFLSNDIQNELVEIMAHEVQREIVEEIKAAPYFSVIADGTTDVSSTEQFSLCVRHVDRKTMTPVENFLGMYNPNDTTGVTLSSSIKDVLLRLCLPLANLRGHCYDGAANMSGRFNGVQALLKVDQPKVLFVHCANHSLDLALQEVSRKVDGMCDVLVLVKDTCNIILESAKRKNIYANVVLPPCTAEDSTSPLQNMKTKQLLPLCTTRFCVRAVSLKRFKSEFLRVEETLKKILQDTNACTPERKSSVRGYLKKMRKFKTVFFLLFSIEVFGPCEDVAKALQKPSLTATGAKQAAQLLSKTMSDLRCEEEFERIFSETEKFIEESQPPGSGDGSENPASRREETPEFEERRRTRRPPLRLEQTRNPAPPVQLAPKDSLRKDYFATLDLLTTEITSRFFQADLETLEGLENLLLDAFKGAVPSEDALNKTLGIHAEDFKVGDLHAQLKILKNLPEEKPTTVTAIAEQLAKLQATTQDLLSEVILLTTLVLTIPASSATSERSFSTLRRVKTDTRATMTQERLTHLLLLRVHQERTKKLDLEKVMREFVSRNETRKAVFGRV